MSQNVSDFINAAGKSETRRRLSIRKPGEYPTGGTASERSEASSTSRAMSNRRLKLCTGFVLFTIVVIAVSLTAVFLVVRASKDGSDSCLDLSPDKSCSSKLRYNFFATKTDYLVAKEHIKEEPESSDKKGCDAQQFYIFSRHAIRYPDQDKIDTMTKELPRLRDRILNASTHDPICEKLQQDLREWTISMVPSDDNKLSESGKNQSQALGERYKTKFLELFSDDLSTYEFGFTSRERTLETAAAFAKGIFNKDLENELKTKYPPQDDVLQFHKACDVILETKGWKKSKHKQVKKFLNGKEMKAILKDISQRFGMDINFDTLKMMLSICQFETTILGQSPWCPLFKPAYIKVFEYLDDLDDYYADSYGLQRNFEQACPMVQHLINKFSSVMTGNGSQPKAVLMFSHAGAIKKVVSRFGLYEDKRPLKADNFCASENRNWRSSYVSPFNSNIAFVLYKCSGKFYIETLFQEKRVIIKGCKSSLCPWKDFVKRYKDISDNCNLNVICTP